MLHYNPNNDPRNFGLRSAAHQLGEAEIPTGIPVFEFTWWETPLRQREYYEGRRLLRVCRPTEAEAKAAFAQYCRDTPYDHNPECQRGYFEVECRLTTDVEVIFDTVCVSDFNGKLHNIVDVSMWADYSFSKKAVVFGGMWAGVPDMPSETVPEEEAVEAWAAQHPNEYRRIVEEYTIPRPPVTSALASKESSATLPFPRTEDGHVPFFVTAQAMASLPQDPDEPPFDWDAWKDDQKDNR